MPQTVFYARILDGTGAPVLGNGMVAVEDGRLAFVGSREEGYPVHPDAQVYAYESYTLMPGLIESHSHLAGYGSGNTLDWVIDPIEVKICQAAHDLQALLMAGYTSVRDMAGYGCNLRRAMQKGLIHGPRIFSAGAAISQTAGHSDVWTDFPVELLADWERTHALADGVEECRKQARNQFRKGADFIKIMTTGGIMDTASNPDCAHYAQKEIAAFVEEAARMGTYVATHAESNAGVYNSVLAGVKCIEHGYMTTDRTLEEMVKRGCYQVPTLSAMTVLMDKVDTMLPHVQEKIKQVVPRTYESVARAHQAGIPMATGADFLSVPGMGEYGQNAQELYELVKVGFSNMEAIQAATKVGAELIHMDDQTGTLETGKLADMILVSGDPLQDVRVLMDVNNIRMVLKEGVIEKNLMQM